MLITPKMSVKYDFEGNANDTSGNGYNGTVSGATIATGKFGQCYSFDGTNDYIRVPANIGSYTDGITIACWVYADSTMTGTYNEIYRIADSSKRVLLAFQEARTIMSFGIQCTAYAELDATIDFSDFSNQWVHVCATYNNTTNAKIIYINGEVLDSTTQTGSLQVSTTQFGYIGSSAGGAEFLKGKIDSFYIWECALSQEDVKRVMLGFQPING